MARHVTTYNDLLPSDSIAMDPQAFDTAVITHGVKMVHYRAMRCPVGLTDPDDVRRAHEHHHNCTNGFTYRKVGTLTALLTGNSGDMRLIDPGLVDGSSIRVTVPRTYDDQPDRTVHIAYADRFYLAELDTEVPDWTVIRAHETGTDHLQYPARYIEHVIDSGGREYDPSLYSVRDGNLVWLTQDRPIAGTVMTVWYLYQPHWYCSRLINEIRVAQVMDPLQGPKMERMLYSAILTRENQFRSAENDPQAPQDPRKQDSPPDGGFGSR